MTELEEQTEHQALPNPFDMTNAGGDGNLLEGLEHELDRSNAEDGDRSPNFPPFYPLVYHNIRAEISPRMSTSVNFMYYLALSFTCSLVASFIASFFSGGMKTCDTTLNSFHWGKEVFMSLFYAIFFPAVIWFVQYWPYYKAMRADDVYVAGEIIQLFVIGILAVFVLGLPGTGMIGFCYMVSAFRHGSGMNKLLSLLLTLWHGTTFIGEIFLYGLLKNPDGVTRDANLLTDDTPL